MDNLPTNKPPLKRLREQDLSEESSPTKKKRKTDENEKLEIKCNKLKIKCAKYAHNFVQRREETMEREEYETDRFRKLQRKYEKLEKKKLKLTSRISALQCDLVDRDRKIRDYENDRDCEDNAPRHWKCVIVREFAKNNEKHYEVKWDNTILKAVEVSDHRVRSWKRKMVGSYSNNGAVDVNEKILV